MSDSVQPHRRQPTRLPHPWDSPGKNTGVGCHFLLQCMKVKSESEVAQSCPTLRNPMDCSLPGSSIHGIFQARVLEWVAKRGNIIKCLEEWVSCSNWHWIFLWIFYEYFYDCIVNAAVTRTRRIWVARISVTQFRWQMYRFSNLEAPTDCRETPGWSGVGKVTWSCCPMTG